MPYASWLQVLTLALALALAVSAAPARAETAVNLLQVSADPFTNPDSQHRTQVEPDTFAWGDTLVAAFQTGRYFDGGASDIGFATSTDGGATWAQGFLPGITKHFGGGPFDRASDPVVAYSAKHNTWMISSLGLAAGAFSNVTVLNSLSTDGGLTWSAPFLVNSQGSPDKNWVVCDNTPTSPFYGNCYTQWDDYSQGNRIYLSTSTDGGRTWGPRRAPANQASGIGGQPIVQPNGTVIVPMVNFFGTAIQAFRSTDGGASWSATVRVAALRTHTVAGGLRAPALPSAEVDAQGRVYVAWQDCRFRSDCSANDIVISTSADGIAWTPVRRVPIDPTTSGVDHFIPGLAIDRTTAVPNTRIGLTYYYYPNASCSASTCQLYVGYVSSTDTGRTWSGPTTLAGPMGLSWLPDTNQGRMFGDYLSTSWVNGVAYAVFPVARPPAGGLFDVAMYAPVGGLPALPALVPLREDEPVLSVRFDQPVSILPPTAR